VSLPAKLNWASEKYNRMIQPKNASSKAKQMAILVTLVVIAMFPYLKLAESEEASASKRFLLEVKPIIHYKCDELKLEQENENNIHLTGEHFLSTNDINPLRTLKNLINYLIRKHVCIQITVLLAGHKQMLLCHVVKRKRDSCIQAWHIF
jgi:hypothetical protein